MDEEWRAIVGFPIYEISSLARVRNKKTGRILSQITNSSGYLSLNLYTGDAGKRRRFKGKLVHRLHYEAFCGAIPEGLTVDHLDFNRQNNRIENYRVCTAAENAARSHAEGRHPKGAGTKPGSGYFGPKPFNHTARGEACGAAKLTEADIVEIRRRRAVLRQSFLAIARDFNVSQPLIGRICRRQQWAHVQDPAGCDYSPSRWAPTLRAKETAPRQRRR